MYKFIVGFTTLLVGLFLLFLFTAPTEVRTDTATIAPTEVTQDKTIIENADIENKPKLLIGSPEAKVTIVEYADFKCPSCNSFHHQAGAQLREQYIDDGIVNIEFRNYPFIGPDSGRTARGSYCANDQGVFTQYHDKLYNYLWDNHYNVGDLPAEFRDIFTSEKIVEIIGSDLEDVVLFESCIAATDYNRYIDADLLLGAEDEVTGTPGFVIGDQKITGPTNFTTFKTLIDIQLKAQ